MTVTVVETDAAVNVQVDGLRVLKVNQKTQAQLDALAAVDGLIPQEIYFITSSNKLAYATDNDSYEYVEADPVGADIRAYRTVSADYEPVLADSFIKVNAASGSKDIDLPSADSVAGKTFTIKKIDSTENAVIVNSADLIDGQASISISIQWEFVNVFSDGDTWSVA